MRSKATYSIKDVLVLVLLLFAEDNECVKKFKTKVKRTKDVVSDVKNNVIRNGLQNSTHDAEKRGFLSHGGLFSLGKVLNFFPVGDELECAVGAGLARSGLCLNPYECRQRDGRAAGDCAKGLGVCCVFEVSCDAVVQNNISYFVSPGFPELWPGEEDCNITIEKVHGGITQLKIDFIHFNIGQPNRSTGACDEDVMLLNSDGNEFNLCGQNHGQHIYYTFSTGETARFGSDDLPSAGSAVLSVRPRGPRTARLWLLKLTQLPLAQAAPHDCLQYYTADNGTITTFNYADNGRHLASQNYRACVRRNTGRCAIRYAPCSERSFRIGPSDGSPALLDPGDMYEVSGPGVEVGSTTEATTVESTTTTSTTTTTTTTTTTQHSIIMMDQQGQGPTDEMMPVQEPDRPQDEVEGSGDDPNVEMSSQSVTASTTRRPSMGSRIWNFIWPSWMWGQRRGKNFRWSPYAQHYSSVKHEDLRFFGYGNFGNGLKGYGRLRCNDRITIPCDNEYFITNSVYTPGVCDPHHCGSAFCPGRRFADCRVESSIAPFAVSVNFGPAAPKRSAEENVGACLMYTQLPCDA